MNENSFSVIAFFNEFRRLIKEINVHPLSEENLIVNKDSFSRLTDDYSELYSPFASLVMDRPRSDADLLFGLEFFEDVFAIGIDMQQPIEVSYEALGLGETELARELVNLLVGLANGQIVVLVTHIDDMGQAVEFLYKQKNATLFTVSRTFAFFTNESKQQDAHYETTVTRNTVDIPKAVINQSLLSEILPQTLAEERANRRPFADLDRPLTREMHKKRTDELTEIWSQDITARWFPGYKKSARIAEKLVSYTYYRYVEVVGVFLLVLTLLTMHERSVADNVVKIFTILLGCIVSGVYLRQKSRFIWLYGILAYTAAIAYLLMFSSFQLDTTWKWIVAILAFEPIAEMIIADCYSLVKKRKNPKAKS